MAAATAWLGLLLLTGEGGTGQVPYRLFDDSTQVADIDFRFVAGRTFEASRLREEVVLSAPGPLAGVQKALDFLPFVPSVGPHPFTPLELQRDVARLRDFYSGFIGTEISYQVEYDESRNEVDVLMVVDEGRPVAIRSVDFATPEGGDPADALPETMRHEWTELLDDLDPETVGRRDTEAERARLVGEVLGWWTTRGWAYVRAAVRLEVDSAAAAADLLLEVDPGPRARVSEISVEGNVEVPEDLIRRSLPFEEGDWFNATHLAEGQRRVFGLELFRLVLVDTPAGQPRDSLVAVRVRVQEGAPRLIAGQVGYVSAGGGITGRADLTHHNLFGGARTLRLGATLQTGALAVGDLAEREYSLSATYRRPFTFNPRLSLSIGPYGQYRDNLIDRSWEVGVASTLLYELATYSYVTVQHRFWSRRILDFRFGSGNSIDLADLVRLTGQGAVDSLGTRVDRSTLSLSATLGRFDPTRPTDALQIRPVVEVTFPARLNTIEFVRLELPVSAYLPLSDRFALAGRAQLGRVYPFGKTVAADAVGGLLQAAQLRDVLLTAGGTASVRGWGNGLVGPKILNLRFTPAAGTDSIVVTSNEYLPIGGLARANGSIELRMPFPGLPDMWGTHVFWDAGKVWTPDQRFQVAGGADSGWFHGAGAGVDAATIVGQVRLSIGYKLNPSFLDLRDPDDVFAAISRGLPPEAVEPSWWRRLHVHVALGQAF